MATYTIPVGEIAAGLLRLEGMLRPQFKSGFPDNKLQKCHKLVRELLDWHDNDSASGVKPAWAQNDTVGHCYRMHLVEGARMHMIMRELPDCLCMKHASMFIGGHVPHTRLDEKGALETDKLFQLHIAARLRGLGCEISSVEKPDSPDIVGRYGSKNFIVECKRPKSFKKLLTRMKGGFKQLSRFQDDNVVCLQALDCSIIIMRNEAKLTTSRHIGRDELYRMGNAWLEMIKKDCECKKVLQSGVCYLFDALFPAPSKYSPMNFGYFNLLSPEENSSSCDFFDDIFEETQP